MTRLTTRAWTLIAALAFGPAVARAESANPLIGKWGSDPFEDDHGMSTIRMTDVYREDGTFNRAMTVHVIHPLGRGMGLRMSWEGIYKVGGPVPGHEGLTELDRTMLRSFMAVLDQDTVNEYNNDKECGYDDWRIGQPKDITGRKCEHSEGDMPLNELIPDAFAIDAKGDLRFGWWPDDEEGNDSPMERATAVDDSMVFHRLD